MFSKSTYISNGTYVNAVGLRRNRKGELCKSKRPQKPHIPITHLIGLDKTEAKLQRLFNVCGVQLLNIKPTGMLYDVLTGISTLKVASLKPETGDLPMSMSQQTACRQDI